MTKYGPPGPLFDPDQNFHYSTLHTVHECVIRTFSALHTAGIVGRSIGLLLRQDSTSGLNRFMSPPSHPNTLVDAQPLNGPLAC